MSPRRLNRSRDESELKEVVEIITCQLTLLVWSPFLEPFGWYFYVKLYTPEQWSLLKWTWSEDASWPENVENVQIFPFAGFPCGFISISDFVWWFCQNLCNGNSSISGFVWWFYQYFSTEIFPVQAPYGGFVNIYETEIFPFPVSYDGFVNIYATEILPFQASYGG